MAKRLLGCRSTVKFTSLARVASFAAQDPQRRTLAEESTSPAVFLKHPSGKKERGVWNKGDVERENAMKRMVLGVMAESYS